MKKITKILVKAVPLWMVLMIVLNSTLAMGQELTKNTDNYSSAQGAKNIRQSVRNVPGIQNQGGCGV